MWPAVTGNSREWIQARLPVPRIQNLYAPWCGESPFTPYPEQSPTDHPVRSPASNPGLTMRPGMALVLAYVLATEEAISSALADSSALVASVEPVALST